MRSGVPRLDLMKASWGLLRGASSSMKGKQTKWAGGKESPIFMESTSRRATRCGWREDAEAEMWKKLKS